MKEILALTGDVAWQVPSRQPWHDIPKIFEDAKIPFAVVLGNYDTEADKVLNGMNKIFIMIGTNDCKTVFSDSLKLVPKNMKSLLEKIKAHPVYQKCHPEIFVISPPSYATDDKLIEKYKGGSQ